MTAELTRGLEHPRASVRLRAAMQAGTVPEPGLTGVLVARCAVEPEFEVREMLTWALTRLPTSLTVPALVAELRSELPRARAQALHTLSKVGDPGAWPAITRALLTDPDDEVARTAWRTAVVLAPEEARPELAAVLLTQLGRGDRGVRLSLSRALIELGESAAPGLAAALDAADPRVRGHASDTERLRRDPGSGSGFAVGFAVDADADR